MLRFVFYSLLLFFFTTTTILANDDAIDNRFSSLENFSNYLTSLETQNDKDWALAAAVVYCEPEYIKLAVENGGDVDTIVEVVEETYLQSRNPGRWIFINNKRIDNMFAPNFLIFSDLKSTANQIDEWKGNIEKSKKITDKYLLEFEYSHDTGGADVMGFKAGPPKSMIKGNLYNVASRSCKLKGKTSIETINTIVNEANKKDGCLNCDIVYRLLKNDSSIVFTAIKYQDDELIDILAPHVTIDAPIKELQKNLHLVNNEILMDKFIDAGADVDGMVFVADNWEEKALRAARNPKTVKLLLERGANIEACNDNGNERNCLFNLTKSSYINEQYVEIIRILLDYGIDIPEYVEQVIDENINDIRKGIKLIHNKDRKLCFILNDFKSNDFELVRKAEQVLHLYTQVKILIEKYKKKYAM